jgi:hypothetical protein
LVFGDRDLIPAKSVDTAVAETASDDWVWLTFDGDGILIWHSEGCPRGTASELAAMVTKILAYERGSSGQGATLISDFNDTYNFLGTSNKVKASFHNQLQST